MEKLILLPLKSCSHDWYMQYDWKCNVCVNLWLRFPSWSERFPLGKTKLVCEASRRCHTFIKSLISLVVTNSHLFLLHLSGTWHFSVY